MKHDPFTAATLSLLPLFACAAFAQPETMAWGNLTGIRVEGQLLELNSSMCVVEPGWTAVSRTGRERQTNRYARNGKTETVNVNNGSARPATLTGLPSGVKELRIYITDSNRGMVEGTRIPVADGKAEFALDAMSYTTLISVTTQ